MATTLTRTVAVVGGGLCGTLVAVNLLRSAPEQAIRVVLIERAPTLGGGAAFAARGYPYLLNVPAGRMSATTDVADEFLEFAQKRFPEATGDDFLPRELYGEYLRDLLARSRRNAVNVTLERWTGEVVTVRRVGDSSRLIVVVEGGYSLVADEVVLATGTPRTTGLEITKEISEHPAFIANPYAADLASSRLFDVPHPRVLLVGTGLTMADAISAMDDASDSIRFTALSRHGLLTPTQTTFKPPVFNDITASSLHLAATLSLRKLTRAVRRLCAEAQRRGGDWREAIGLVRNSAPALWRSLRPDDRARFLRHLETYWNLHRHRLPALVRQRIDTLQASGRLQVHAGRIRKIAPSGRQLEVSWQLRGSDTLHAERFDGVIHCAGPNYRVSSAADPLWRSLLQSGLCAPDRHELGIRVDSQGAVIDAEGEAIPNVFYVGALLRANYWESTAVAELRVYCEQLASRIAQTRAPAVRWRGHERHAAFH